jgi:hypothetical protein
VCAALNNQVSEIDSDFIVIKNCKCPINPDTNPNPPSPYSQASYPYIMAVHTISDMTFLNVAKPRSIIPVCIVFLDPSLNFCGP